MAIRRRHVLTAAAAGLSAPLLARAQTPAWDGPKRIQFVVPFNAGGSADTMARGLAQYMPEELGSASISVVNRPGASGAAGAAWFTQQRDDGSAFLVMQCIPFLANAILRFDAPIKWDQFSILNIQWNDYAVLVVPKDSPYKTLPELITAVKEKPGTISSAVMAGSGAYIQHFILLDKLGLPRDALRYVTYDGGAPVRTAVAGGHVNMTIVAAKSTLGVQDRVRALAVVDDEPSSDWPAPLINQTLKDAYGFTMPLVSNYAVSLIAQSSFSKKHPELQKKFVEAYHRTVRRADYQEAMAKAGIPTQWYGPERSTKIANEAFETLAAYAPKRG